MTTTPPLSVMRDLARLVESEALGEAFFATAAKLSLKDDHRRCWQALRDLEIQTQAGVDSFLRRAEMRIAPTHRIASAVGASGGTGTRLLPHGMRLRMIRQGTKRYLPSFQRLAEFYASTSEAAFFRYVVEHELAIVALTTQWLAGKRNALDPVQRLLDEGVPGLS